MTLTEWRALILFGRLFRMVRHAGLWLFGGVPREQYESLRAKLEHAEREAERFRLMELGQRSEIVELERFIKRQGLWLKLYTERRRARLPGGRFWWEQEQKAS